MERTAEACRTGNLEYVSTMDPGDLQRLIGRADEDGRSLLHAAASSGSVPLVLPCLTACMWTRGLQHCAKLRCVVCNRRICSDPYGRHEARMKAFQQQAVCHPMHGVHDARLTSCLSAGRRLPSTGRMTRCGAGASSVDHELACGLTGWCPCITCRGSECMSSACTGIPPDAQPSSMLFLARRRAGRRCTRRSARGTTTWSSGCCRRARTSASGPAAGRPPCIMPCALSATRH